MTQNNLETTSVDSPPTNDSDFHFTAKLKQGDPLGLPWEVLYLLLLELSPSWLWVAIIQSHLYSTVHKFFIIPVPSMTLFHVFKTAMDLFFFCQMSLTLLWSPAGGGDNAYVLATTSNLKPKCCYWTWRTRNSPLNVFSIKTTFFLFPVGLY